MSSPPDAADALLGAWPEAFGQLAKDLGVFRLQLTEVATGMAELPQTADWTGATADLALEREERLLAALQSLVAAVRAFQGHLGEYHRALTRTRTRLTWAVSFGLASRDPSSVLGHLKDSRRHAAALYAGAKSTLEELSLEIERIAPGNPPDSRPPRRAAPPSPEGLLAPGPVTEVASPRPQERRP